MSYRSTMFHDANTWYFKTQITPNSLRIFVSVQPCALRSLGFTLPAFSVAELAAVLALFLDRKLGKIEPMQLKAVEFWPHCTVHNST